MRIASKHKQQLPIFERISSDFFREIMRFGFILQFLDSEYRHGDTVAHSILNKLLEGVAQASSLML